MNDEKHWRDENEGEFDRLGNAGQEGCKGSGEQDTGRNFGIACLTNHSQCRGGQTKHHHREEARLEEARRRITSEVALKIAMRAVEIAKLEPDIAVDDVVQ